MITIFTIRDETRKLLATLPNVTGLFLKEIKNSRVTYQIFRLLDNCDFNHQNMLVEIIERLLTNKEYRPYVRSVLKEKDRMTFGDKINEVFLLYFLDVSGFKVDIFDAKKAALKVPEFKAQKNNHTYLIELWTFHEVYAYKAFTDLLFEGLKYMDNPLYFEASIRLQQVYDVGDADELYYQDVFREKFKDQRVFNSSLNKFLARIKRGIENGKKKYSIKIGKNDKVVINIKNIAINGGKRYIDPQFPTTSFSTVEYFEEPPDYKNEFYQKLKDKLNQKQLGLKEEGTIRLFMVNFSDTSEGGSLVRETCPPYHNKNFYEGLTTWCKQNCCGLTDLLVPVDASLDFCLGKITYSSNQEVRNDFEKDFSCNLQQ